MDIAMTKVGGVCVLQLAGAVSYPDGTEALRRMSRELVDKGETRFVIDMLNVPWLDSSGIGEIVGCYKRAREARGEVKLVLREKPYVQFTYCHLQKMFEIFDSVDPAVASFTA